MITTILIAIYATILTFFAWLWRAEVKKNEAENENLSLQVKKIKILLLSYEKKSRELEKALVILKSKNDSYEKRVSEFNQVVKGALKKTS